MSELDIEYYGRSGNKEVSPLVEYLLQSGDGDLDQTVIFSILARSLLSHFGAKWRRLYEITVMEYAPLQSYAYKEHRESTTVLDSESSGSSESENTDDGSVYAYNSSSPSPQSKDTNVGSSSSTGTRDDTTTFEEDIDREGTTWMQTRQRMLIDEWRLRLENDVFKVVFSDVDSILTCPMY